MEELLGIGLCPAPFEEAVSMGVGRQTGDALQLATDRPPPGDVILSDQVMKEVEQGNTSSLQKILIYPRVRTADSN